MVLKDTPKFYNLCLLFNIKYEIHFMIFFLEKNVFYQNFYIVQVYPYVYNKIKHFPILNFIHLCIPFFIEICKISQF